MYLCALRVLTLALRAGSVRQRPHELGKLLLVHGNGLGKELLHDRAMLAQAVVAGLALLLFGDVLGNDLPVLLLYSLEFFLVLQHIRHDGVNIKFHIVSCSAPNDGKRRVSAPVWCIGLLRQ